MSFMNWLLNVESFNKLLQKAEFIILDSGFILNIKWYESYKNLLLKVYHESRRYDPTICLIQSKKIPFLSVTVVPPTLANITATILFVISNMTLTIKTSKYFKILNYSFSFQSCTYFISNLQSYQQFTFGLGQKYSCSKN